MAASQVRRRKSEQGAEFFLDINDDLCPLKLTAQSSIFTAQLFQLALLGKIRSRLRTTFGSTLSAS